MWLTEQEQAIWNDGYIAGQKLVRKELEPIIKGQDSRIRILEYAASSLLKDRTGREIETFMGIPIEKAMEILMEWREKHDRLR